MLSNDVPIQNVQQMLGHKDIRQTQRYAKVLAEDVHESFDEIEEKMKLKTKVSSTERSTERSTGGKKKKQ